jgi:hypothetical protein
MSGPHLSFVVIAPFSGQYAIDQHVNPFGANAICFAKTSLPLEPEPLDYRGAPSVRRRTSRLHAT